MHLVVLAAGRGSRFADRGILAPKPLVPYRGRPLFSWAAESARQCGRFSALHFVVLSEHVAAHGIDKHIAAAFPGSRLVVIDEVTAGAAETAAIAAERIGGTEPVVFMDCDLAFDYADRGTAFGALASGEASAALCVFPSANPAYSYVRRDAIGRFAGTVEKQVVSDTAIAGLYGFASPPEYLRLYAGYRERCEYKELFLSGVLNGLDAASSKVELVLLGRHVGLGTPGELDAALASPEGVPAWSGG